MQTQPMVTTTAAGLPYILFRHGRDSIRAVHASHGWHVGVNVILDLTTDSL